jgi:hypothetical protein
MRARTLSRWLAISLALFLLASGPARAQGLSSVHVSGGVLADVKRFSGDPDEDTLGGEAIGGTVAAGARVSERWELSIAVDVPRATEDVQERSIVLRLVRLDVQSITRNRPITVSALARIQPRDTGRARIGYIAGLSFIGLRQRFSIVAPPEAPSSLVPETVRTVDYSAAPTAGVDVLIPVSSHLAVVPAFQATVFRGSETSALLLRPRVSARWTF